MNTALKVFVYSVSFLFTFFGCVLLLSLLFVPLSEAVGFWVPALLARSLALVPLVLGLLAGVRAARVSWRQEEQRQVLARAKRQAAGRA